MEALALAQRPALRRGEHQRVRVARHVGNAVLREDARGARLAKERRDSSRKIDAAVDAVMTHDRAAVLAGDRGPSMYV